MQIKFTRDNIITTLPDAQNVRVGEIKTVHPDVGRHLIDAGVAIEIKVQEPVRKKDQPSSASQADPASQPKTATKRRGRPRKSSQSTTAGE